MRYLIPALLELALVVFCIVDVLNHRDERPHEVPKVVWVIIILLFPFVGAAVWIALRISSANRQTRRPSGPVLAPDDDPQYLIWLREQQRRRKLEEGDK